MIAIDTNVLLRYLLGDDLQQQAAARGIITALSPVLVTDVVLVEAAWTLGGGRYGLGRADIARVIHGLIDNPCIAFENLDAVWEALRDYEEAERIEGKDLDFADALVVSKAKHWARTRGLAIQGVYSFDKAACQLDGVRQL